ncbi:hypothetical protein MLD38_027893 [Melastoma candidum]|uniref:Uncharacterized protein n=1 Tax=Melastoma candidum TaxID=119954 RepID=A0ACB9MZJ0_9MYRT|nr:hypothetical protein MLD38_027893 [Melastoma candidum]
MAAITTLFQWLLLHPKADSSIPAAAVAMRPQPLTVTRPPKGFESLVIDREKDGHMACVTNPSLANATTLFFKSSHYNLEITVEDNESEERLLNRFRREVNRCGIIRECKRRRFFETSQEYRKRKTREANRKRAFSMRRTPQQKMSRKMKKKKEKKEKKEAAKNNREGDEEENDNWEVPEGELPY